MAKKKIVQQPPFTVLVEPTEGCNLGCSFCGLRGMREKGTKPWNHERFQAARIMLYNYSRNFRPCSGCTNISMRVGFLPDSSGQESLPEITPEIKKLAQSVHKDGFLSPIIIRRKWEK